MPRLTIFILFVGGRQKWVPLNLEGSEGAVENSNNDAILNKSPTSPEATSPGAKGARSPTNRFNSSGTSGNVSPVRGGRGGRGGGRGGRGGRGRPRYPRGKIIETATYIIHALPCYHQHL